MGILAGKLGSSVIKTYEEKWEVASVEQFDAEDLAIIDYAVAQKSGWGISVKFHCKTGGFFFIPVSKAETSINIGDMVDPSKLWIQELHMYGKDPIVRCQYSKVIEHKADA